VAGEPPLKKREEMDNRGLPGCAPPRWTVASSIRKASVSGNSNPLAMLQTPDSDTITEGIRICAAAQFLPDESNPDAPYFLFMYRIVLRNESDQRVKLLSRHWVIRDAYNEREDVRGAGVVGEYPLLRPGEKYEYTSTCPLRTSWGTMEGAYEFEVCDTGRTFEVNIGRFFLVPSAQLKQVSAD